MDGLLSGVDRMATKSTDHWPSGHGTMPANRPIGEYLKYGIAVVDKPSNPSSHEVVTWVKDVLGCERTGHSGTLDPKVTGVLTVCLNRATRVAKSQQNAGKTYVCGIEFESETTAEKFGAACRRLTGHLFQRPPLMCAVKRDLRLRWVYGIDIIEFTPRKALFEVRCEAGTYIRTLCTHIGLYIGCGAWMSDLRRTRSGCTVEDECVTLHDLQDAFYTYTTSGDEKYLRRVVRPLESLLVGYPRIMIKDSAVNSICYGGQLCAAGVLRYDSFDTNTAVVLMTAKGEAVALATPLVSSCQMPGMERGMVARTKRVIMEKDLYPRCWGIMSKYEVLSDE